MVKTIYMTVSDFWEEKQKELLERLTNRKEYEGLYRKYILPYIGAMRIFEVGRSDVEIIIRSMREGGLSVCQTQKVKALLRRFFHLAVQERLIAENVIDTLPGIPTEHLDLKMLTEEDEVRLLRAFQKTKRGEMYTLMMITGIQFRELAGCRIRDLNEEEKCLYITQTICNDSEETIPQERTLRKVPLTETAIRMLQRLIKRIPEEERWGERLILVTCHGAPFRRIPDDDLRIIRRESGIQDFSVRMFGYVYGMRAMAMGMNPKVINQYLGYRTGFNLNRFAQANRRKEQSNGESKMENCE